MIKIFQVYPGVVLKNYTRYYRFFINFEKYPDPAGYLVNGSKVRTLYFEEILFKGGHCFYNFFKAVDVKKVWET